MSLDPKTVIYISPFAPNWQVQLIKVKTNFSFTAVFLTHTINKTGCKRSHRFSPEQSTYGIIRSRFYDQQNEDHSLHSALQ